MAASASRTTLPPSPPSPPSGPPRGTNFSRRKLTHPAPPSPPLTKTSISSTNMAWPDGNAGSRAGSGRLLRDADVAIGLGEQGMVHPEADVGARLEPGTALADQDAPGGHELPTEPLDPQH